MVFHGRKLALRHIGTLRGRGNLSIGRTPHLGTVNYEIDGFVDRVQRTANGRIEGGADILRQAFEAGAARIELDGGTTIDVVLADPDGGPAAEIVVSGSLPTFAH